MTYLQSRLTRPLQPHPKPPYIWLPPSHLYSRTDKTLSISILQTVLPMDQYQERKANYLNVSLSYKEAKHRIMCLINLYERCRQFNRWNQNKYKIKSLFSFRSCQFVLCGYLSPWHVASSYCGWRRQPPYMEGSCDIYWISSRRQPSRGRSLAWGWALGYQPFTIKYYVTERLKSPRNLTDYL
jgi:hypothetical protein